jgi:hypothetical protein
MIGSSSFGTAFVAGKNLVPIPAAGMTAVRILTAAAYEAAALVLRGG